MSKPRLNIKLKVFQDYINYPLNGKYEPLKDYEKIQDNMIVYLINHHLNRDARIKLYLSLVKIANMQEMHPFNNEPEIKEIRENKRKLTLSALHECIDFYEDQAEASFMELIL